VKVLNSEKKENVYLQKVCRLLKRYSCIKVDRLRPFVLLIRVVLRWKLVLSIGERYWENMEKHFILWPFDKILGRGLHWRGFEITHIGQTILGSTPLEERSAPRKNIYLITHNTHNRQTFMTPADSNSQSQQASGRRPTPYTTRTPVTADKETPGESPVQVPRCPPQMNWSGIESWLHLWEPSCVSDWSEVWN